MTDTSYMVMDYPEPPYRPEDEPRECSCGYPFGEDGAFLVDGEWVCAQCFMDCLDVNYTPEELADALGFDHISKEDAEYGHTQTFAG